MSLLMGRHSTPQIVGRADVDVVIAQFEEVDVQHVVTVSLRSYGVSGDTLALLAFGWPATRSPSGRRVAERVGGAVYQAIGP